MSIVPWMVNHVVASEEPTRYALEYVRGGDIEAGDQVIDVLVL